MAATSSGKVNKFDKMRPSECTCPICMCILIEPVTLPCNHELCMPCFQHHVAETSLSCPICRVRIAVWARRATRENKLINEARWSEIQKAFPEKIKRRLEGTEDDDDDDEDFEGDYYVPSISEPGELRKEYEEEQNKFANGWLAKKQEEEMASLRLIAELQAEEKKRQKQERRDAEIAARLSREINGVSPSVSHSADPVSITDTPSRVHPVPKQASFPRSNSKSTTSKQTLVISQGHLKMWFPASRKESKESDYENSQPKHEYPERVSSVRYRSDSAGSHEYPERGSSVRYRSDSAGSHESDLVLESSSPNTDSQAVNFSQNAIHKLQSKPKKASSTITKLADIEPESPRKRLCLKPFNK